jgi:hypothetical protein
MDCKGGRYQRGRQKGPLTTAADLSQCLSFSSQSPLSLENERFFEDELLFLKIVGKKQHVETCTTSYWAQFRASKKIEHTKKLPKNLTAG